MKQASLLALLVFLPTLALAWDDTRNIRAEPPGCATGVSCSVAVTPGFMAGQASLDFSAEAPALAGTGFSVEVFDGTGALVQQRSGGVMSNGSLTALIASAQLLAPGTYRYVISGIAEGRFRVVSGEVPENQEDAEETGAGASAPAPAAAGLAGIWYGIASTVGQIELAADGSYRYNGSPGGHWRQQGNRVVFDGALSAWNGGVASLNDGVLEFRWTNAEGFNNWFVFQR
jgi:hypothetical protein